jgi:hypothetical protein
MHTLRSAFVTGPDPNSTPNPSTTISNSLPKQQILMEQHDLEELKYLVSIAPLHDMN